jgi:CheY-like chemotaxis protein
MSSWRLIALVTTHNHALLEDQMKLLIVDDNDGIRRLLRRTLAEIASNVWECKDGSDALAAYEEHRPDIVLMDIRMPLMDGLTATRQIRKYDPSARIIVITEYEGDDMRAAALEAGALECIQKCEISSLPDVISSMTDTA